LGIGEPKLKFTQEFCMSINRFILTFSFFVFLLTGCQGKIGDSAEQAAARQILHPSGDGAVVDPGSIEKIQEQELDNDTYIVLSFARTINSRNEKCLMMYQMHHELFGGWAAGSGSGSCTEIGAADAKSVEPLQLSGGTLHGADQTEPDVSFVLGRVHDDAIVKVIITWKDGLLQETPVIKGSFLAIRSGMVELKSAAGMNAENGVHFTETR
jgi:hypothetical protein